MQRRGRPYRWLVSLAALAVLAGACGGGEEATTGGGGEEGGQTISLLHGIKGQQEQAALQAAIDAYQDASGNTVEVEFSPQFETVIVTRVQGGNPPDVALYPQPGLLKRTVDQDRATPLEDVGVDVAQLEDDLVSGMVDTGTFDDTTYGVVTGLNFKSLLWYPADDFEAEGHEVPETWEDMLALTKTISDTGTPAWCIGIESAESTGWVATDWIEDIMLRLHGPDVYDQWVQHEVTFDSEEVRQAFQELEEIWLTEGYVLGGTTAILQTPFLDAADPMFEDPPGCWLHRQAGFIAAEFPEEAELGTDYDLAFLPPIDESVGNGALFQGDTVAVHSDSQTAGEFVEFLVSTEGQEAWFGHEGAGKLSVRSDFDPEVYPSDALSRQGELFTGADFARFDASDSMPGEVGAGAFWTEVVAWISGGQDLDTTLKNIDAAWPGS
ncbi:MAG TPA: ABC transporter substrate-binding protein [Nitriliruptorales bacterium]|nr:ABC transporter substrate-binding protein [Nitriliruptorales bacterium]